MGRRSSGWTVVKNVARAIDRANRQTQRARIAEQKSYLRQQQSSAKEQQKFFEKIIREATRIQERFNVALSAANATTNISTKEAKLEEARKHFKNLRDLEDEYTFFELSNLTEVEKNIDEIQKELDLLKAEEEGRQSLEQNALKNTAKAQQMREDIANVLSHTLAVNDAIDWEILKDHQVFLIPKPIKPPKPMVPPKPESVEIPDSPNPAGEKYKPRIPFFMNFFQEKKRIFIEDAKKLYEEDLLQWQKDSEEIKSNYQKNYKEWEEKRDAVLEKWKENYKSACDEWIKRKEEHEANQNQYNQGIDKLRKDYEAVEKTAIEEYCKLVLARSEYPFVFSKDYQIEYNPEAKLLALDYQLPTIDVIPSLKEEKFIKTKGEIKTTLITDKQHREIYETLLYAMIIRIIHELFEADTIHAIDTIAVNGWVTALCKATGHDETRCIVTINTNKEAFHKINLANIDVKECFKSLKGIGSARLSELVPVAPVITLNREDRRFVESYAVVEHLAEDDNLALMDWEDFEHLIRELFEKEFCSDGSEVRVTQASRDGGVDAVIFDPDPIRGGKIVVQAKRYTNTVGVSAVRDLYGTVQHEGAMKGILITTSNYGGDAYDFAKGKPLTLMNGSNLIHLLERHGRKARINLLEAKNIS